MHTRSWVMITVFLCIAVFLQLNAFLWFKLDNIPAYNDQAHHLFNLSAASQALWLHDLRVLNLLLRDCYPFVPYFIVSLFGMVYPPGVPVYFPFNLFCVALILLAIYWTGRSTMGEREAVFACVVFSLFPFVYAATRIFTLDLFLTALVSVFSCLCLFPRGMNSRVHVLLLSLVFVIGMLVKQSFPIYVIGPLAFIVARALRSSVGRRHLALFLIAAVFPVLLAYSTVLYKGTRYLYFAHCLEADIYSPLNRVERFLFYIIQLPFQCGWVSFSVFVIAFVFYLSRLTLPRIRLLSWLVIPLLILTIAPKKYAVYSLPFLPPLALISSWGVFQISAASARRTVMSAMVLFGLLVHYLLMFNLSVELRVGNRAVENKLIVSPPFGLKPFAENTHIPGRKDWAQKQNEIIEVIVSCVKGIPGGRRPLILLVNASQTSWSVPLTDKLRDGPTENFHVLNEWGLRYALLRQRVDVELVAFVKYRWRGRLPNMVLTWVPLASAWWPETSCYRLVYKSEFADGSLIYLYELDRELPENNFSSEERNSG